jgi:hypothetical protein
LPTATATATATQRQRQRQRRHYRQNRSIAVQLQHTGIHALTPQEHQTLAEMRGAAGAAYFAGRAEPAKGFARGLTGG